MKSSGLVHGNSTNVFILNTRTVLPKIAGDKISRLVVLILMIIIFSLVDALASDLTSLLHDWWCLITFARIKLLRAKLKVRSHHDDVSVSCCLQKKIKKIPSKL